MLPDDTRRKIENITSGIVIEGQQDHCTTIRNFLCRSFATSTTVKENFEGNAVIKKEQAGLISGYSTNQNLWVTDLPATFLAKGGEARVYLQGDTHVLKLNSAVYYATWLEFFNSILLHNFIFANTAYNLVGFLQEEEELVAILQQPFVRSDALVDLNDIKKLLEFNAFENNRNHDYVHKELGLILEDMHDENVLVNSETLFFIDTVFYTVTPQKE